MLYCRYFIATLVLPAIPLVTFADAPEVRVHDADGFRRAAAAAKPSTRILLEPGEYAGGFHFEGLKGEKGKPIVIGAADPKRPPVIQGGTGGLHFTDPQHVEIRDLVIRGASGNGLNIDDGGSYETPARHVLISGLQVGDIGTGGNNDAIKLSGLDDFLVEKCRIEKWGGRGGSGIDLVGCHRGVIEGCTFRNSEKESSTGVQAKGASSDIAIRGNRFEDAGGRAINLGGSTGFKFFRPALESMPAGERYEAKDIRVEGNIFVGGGAPLAFVGVDGAVVRFNTIYRPGRWVFRILQETRDAAFVPSRKGVFSDNIIVFRADELSTVANIGPGTDPKSFQAARNWWFAIDRPDRSRPDLPVREEDGTYGKDPQLVDPEKGDLHLRPGSPALKFGADALPK